MGAKKMMRSEILPTNTEIVREVSERSSEESFGNKLNALHGNPIIVKKHKSFTIPRSTFTP
jgi:hypothetical protein